MSDLEAARARIAAEPELTRLSNLGLRFVPAGDPEARPGDVIVFSLSSEGAVTSHFEIVPPKRSFLARLAHIVRGRK